MSHFRIVKILSFLHCEVVVDNWSLFKNGQRHMFDCWLEIERIQKTFFLFFTLFSSWHFLCIFFLPPTNFSPSHLSMHLPNALWEKTHQQCFYFQIIWPYKCSLPGVNFISVQAAFTCADPNRAKKIVKLSVFFALLGSTCIKAVYKMLVKLFTRFNLSPKKYYRLQVFL